MTRDEILTYLNEQIKQAKANTPRLMAQEDSADIIGSMRSIRQHCRDYGTIFEKLWYHNREAIESVEDVADMIYTVYQDGKISEDEIFLNVNSYFIENLTRWFCLNKQLLKNEDSGVFPDGTERRLTRDGVWFLFKELQNKKAITAKSDTALAEIVSDLTGFSAGKLRGSELDTSKGKEKLKTLLEKIIAAIDANPA